MSRPIDDTKKNFSKLGLNLRLKFVLSTFSVTLHTELIVLYIYYTTLYIL